MRFSKYNQLQQWTNFCTNFSPKTPSPASPPNYTPVPSPHDGLPIMAVGRSQLLARWPGILSRIVSAVQLALQTVSGAYSNYNIIPVGAILVHPALLLLTMRCINLHSPTHSKSLSHWLTGRCPHDGLPSLTGDRNVTVDLPTFPAVRRRPRIPPRPADTSTQSPIT